MARSLRRGTLLAAGWLVLCPPAALAAAPADIAMFVRLVPNLVRVEADNRDGSVSIGSGVIVGPGLVATNCHVTRDAVDITLIRGGERHGVDSESSDVGRDLCLLHSPTTVGDRPIAIAAAAPRAGQAVFAVGFALGNAPRLAPGEISSVYEYDGGRVVETTAAFAAGASGGGLFNADGELVGIIAFHSRGRESRYFCLPARWVSEAIDRFAGRPVEPLSGFAFWQLPTDEQPFFLRAATFEAEGDWAAVVDVAQRWTDSEASNASSWFALGNAYAHLNRKAQSIDAFREAVALEGDFASAWYSLGVAYAESCMPAEEQGAERRLRSLDPRLAEALASRGADCSPNGAER